MYLALIKFYWLGKSLIQISKIFNEIFGAYLKPNIGTENQRILVGSFQIPEEEFGTVFSSGSVENKKFIKFSLHKVFPQNYFSEIFFFEDKNFQMKIRLPIFFKQKFY